MVQCSGKAQQQRGLSTSAGTNPRLSSIARKVNETGYDKKVGVKASRFFDSQPHES